MSSQVSFRQHVESCFNNMAFPSLIRETSQSQEEANKIIDEVANKLLAESFKEACRGQGLKEHEIDKLDHNKAISECHAGKLMRLLTIFISDYEKTLPKGYLQRIDQLAQNHFFRIITPDENVNIVFSQQKSENARQYAGQPTLAQESASVTLVCGAPGVGKSTFSESIFPGGFVDTSTDTYSNLIASRAVTAFKLQKNKDPYRIGGLEGSLVKRRFIDLVNRTLKSGLQIPNIVISTIKLCGPELEGFFASAVRNINVELLFCSTDTALKHMTERGLLAEKRQSEIHISPQKTIEVGLKDASNQLFSNKDLLPDYQKQYSSMIHYLRAKCAQNRKDVTIDIVLTDKCDKENRRLSMKSVSNEQGIKEFSYVAQIMIDANGNASLVMPEDPSDLQYFLAQSGHKLEELQSHLAESLATV